MNLQKALSSSVGSKLLIAFTGLSLVVFLIGHLAGNLLFLAGPDAFNHYSHALISNPLVYVAEAGILGVFVLHVFKALLGFASNRSARPQRYAVKTWVKTKNAASRKSLASTTMVVTGAITLIFAVTHLATFKFGTYYETPDGMRDLYRLQLEIFANPAYVVFYMAAMAVLFFHLWHGVTSAAQTFGLDSPAWTPRILFVGRALSLVLGAGFFILPIATFVVGLK